MNGVFFLDLARDASIVAPDVREYVEEYYAWYPALSLGHHPILASLMMAPVFGLPGISVSSARVVPLGSRVLDWLRSRVTRAPFVERLRVPLRSSAWLLQDVMARPGRRE